MVLRVKLSNRVNEIALLTGLDTRRTPQVIDRIAGRMKLDALKPCGQKTG